MGCKVVAGVVGDWDAMKLTSIVTLLVVPMVLTQPVAAQGFKPDNKAGDVAWARKDYAAALRHYGPLAEQGYVRPQYFLGNAYQYGKGVSADHKKAARWYKKAAKQGSVIAQGELGRMYIAGRGVLQDLIMAYVWLNVSTANGNMLLTSEARDKVLARLNSAERNTARKLSKLCFNKPARCPEYSDD